MFNEKHYDKFHQKEFDLIVAECLADGMLQEDAEDYAAEELEEMIYWERVDEGRQRDKDGQ